MLTLVIIKPNAYPVRHKILRYFESYDYEIVSERLYLTKQVAEELYDVHKEKPFFKSLIAFMTSGPVMVLKINSMEDTLIQDVRHIVEKLIRPKYAIDGTANAIHASDSIEAAEYEYGVIKKYLKQ